MITRQDIKKAFQIANPGKEFCFRWDGRLEYHCSHGVGHTVYAPPWKQDNGTYFRDYIHGCCHERCCKNIIIPDKYKEENMEGHIDY